MNDPKNRVRQRSRWSASCRYRTGYNEAFSRINLCISAKAQKTATVANQLSVIYFKHFETQPIVLLLIFDPPLRPLHLSLGLVSQKSKIAQTMSVAKLAHILEG